ncbi:MAG: P1 family peptidase [Acidimicrobiia bacterium]
MTLTSVPGVEVGHWTDRKARTGCTVVLLPEPNVAAVEIRGAAPGSRETALLEPGMKVEQIQAIFLTGGSAYGLAAADGVVARLEQHGRGHPTLSGVVPIVPAAVVYDLHLGNRPLRPGPEQGATAFDQASGGPVEHGNVGAGTGATVAGWRGFDNVRWGGIGSVSMAVGHATLGALVVVNGVGDVFTLAGEPLTGGSAETGPPAMEANPSENTTLVVLATDARLVRTDLMRLAVRAQDAIATCLRPSHTRYDGDAAFAVSCGAAEADLDALGEAAYVSCGRAIEAALRAADRGNPLDEVRE